MSDALTKVKSDLGTGAVILHTRTIKRGGVLGIGAHSLVEITATADPRVAAARAATAGRNPKPPAPQDKAVGRPEPPTSGPTTESVPRPTTPAEPTTRRPDPPDPSSSHTQATAPPPSSEPRTHAASDPVLRGEVQEIRVMVKDLLRKTGQAVHPQLPAELVDHYTHLISQDVADELAMQLLDRVAGTLRRKGAVHWDDRGRQVGGEAASPDSIRDELRKAVVETLPPAQPLKLSATGRPTVVAMVGPTGVGKTTTIAKLAANMKLREGKSVGMITIDTYRIAAVEQLKTYSEILQVPLVAVNAPEDMQPAIQRMSDRDLILIDTAGRSQKDEMRIAELGRFLTAARPDQVHLVLSSTSREEAVREAVRNFGVLGPRHIIFTKLDEAVGFGVILNVLRSVDLQLSYLTDGQSVPADIEVGSAGRIAQLLLGPDPESVSMLDRTVKTTGETPVPQDLGCGRIGCAENPLSAPAREGC